MALRRVVPRARDHAPRGGHFKPIPERYQRMLYHYRRQNGSPLSFWTQYQLRATSASSAGS
ncbi:MAG: hypothetical protein IPN83_18920 [Holophagales bacterium]|nr:hypothetical protein [Holophagales bacterium]